MDVAELQTQLEAERKSRQKAEARARKEAKARRICRQEIEEIQAQAQVANRDNEAIGRFQLVAVSGPRSGDVFDLNRRTILIGNGGSCDIVLEGPGISRHHAQLILEDGKYYVREMGSTYGTSINGKKVITQLPIKAGDHLEVGNAVLEMQAKGVRRTNRRSNHSN